jgi:hypothetical protein
VESAGGAAPLVTTDIEGDWATPLDPLETAVTTPGGGFVAIQESEATLPAPAGPVLLNLQAGVTAPPGTPASPVQLEFVIDASVAPAGWWDRETLILYRDGAALADCVGPEGIAFPDPCVADRTALSDGDAWAFVLASTGGQFNFAVPPCAVPGEVAGAGVLADKQTIAWSPAPDPDATYDVSRGQVQQLPVGAGTSETCLAAGLAQTRVADSAEPTAGSAFWYLVRAGNACGSGGYGSQSDGGPRHNDTCP